MVKPLQGTARMAGGGSDRFFTSEETVKECFEFLRDEFQKLGKSIYDFDYIEPSAGDGVWLRGAKVRFIAAIDIRPVAKTGITTLDWFQVKCQKRRPTIVIGNPPFGHSGGLALAFMRHAYYIGMDYVAFILPRNFNRPTTQARVHPNLWPIATLDLPQRKYWDAECEEYVIHDRIFQIWEWRREERSPLEYPEIPGIEWLPAYTVEATHAIRVIGTTPSIGFYRPSPEQNPTAFRYLKVSPFIELHTRDIEIELREISKYSTAQMYITKYDLMTAITRHHVNPAVTTAFNQRKVNHHGHETKTDRS